MGEDDAILLCKQAEKCQLGDCIHITTHSRRAECDVRCPQRLDSVCVIASDGDAVMQAMIWAQDGGEKKPKSRITYKRL